MPMTRIVSICLLLLVCICTSAQQRAIDKEFLDAVEAKDLTKINLLLGKGANINAREPINGYFALQYAINWPDAALVKLLLDKGANVNLADDGGTTALIEAVGGNTAEYTAIVKLLVDRGADVHAHHDAAIFTAVKEAAPEVVRLLLVKGAPVNAHNAERDGNTVLMQQVQVVLRRMNDGISRHGGRISPGSTRAIYRPPTVYSPAGPR